MEDCSVKKTGIEVSNFSVDFVDVVVVGMAEEPTGWNDDVTAIFEGAGCVVVGIERVWSNLEGLIEIPDDVYWKFGDDSIPE